VKCNPALEGPSCSHMLVWAADFCVEVCSEQTETFQQCLYSDSWLTSRKPCRMVHHIRHLERFPPPRPTFHSLERSTGNRAVFLEGNFSLPSSHKHCTLFVFRRCSNPKLLLKVKLISV
jgi:hypothetical protein